MLQAMKTGALLRFACEAGGILGRGDAAQRAALERYGAAVGQAFQIADDLLDLEGDPALVGKRPARTPPPARRPWSACSASPAPRRGCSELVAEAEAALAPFGPAAAILIEGAKFVADRHA